MSQQQLPPPQSKWIWPFELLEQIGEGGMGIVYRARYVVNGRFVALKMLPKDVNDPTALARFERELEVLKNLRHPNIVRCFGGVCENKRRFYAMELVEGGTLEDKLQAKGKLPWEEVVQLGIQICAGLGCLHERDVVHRDVKPSNFLLTPAGQVKLSDFGLASVASSRKITAAGKTAGTFLYMAPEQIRGKPVSAQTDLYALGCVMYEMITGVAPFVGETPAATLHLHCNTPAPRPSEKSLDCPVALERIILRLLEKDPSARFASAGEVAGELKKVSPTVVATSRELVKWPDSPVESPVLPKATPTPKRIQIPVKANVPVWISIALLVALVASLEWNIVQLGQKATAQKWEALWLEAADSPEAPVRIAALNSLAQMGRRSPRGMERLEAGLEDADPRVRAASANALAAAGADAKPQLPALLSTQKKDSSPEVRTAAEAAIKRIQNASAESHVPVAQLFMGLVLLAGAGGAIMYWKLGNSDQPAVTREIPVPQNQDARRTTE